MKKNIILISLFFLLVFSVHAWGQFEQLQQSDADKYVEVTNLVSNVIEAKEKQGQGAVIEPQIDSRTQEDQPIAEIQPEIQPYDTLQPAEVSPFQTSEAQTAVITPSTQDQSKISLDILAAKRPQCSRSA